LAEIRKFFFESGIETTFVTGNHDPDISTCHFREVAAGKVLVTHGDIAFDEIVPWGRDAGLIRGRLREAWGGPAQAAAANLETRLNVYRAVAATIPQRHQSEQNPLTYAVRFAADTLWPPWRIPHICQAWRVQPARMAALMRRQRPEARFVIVGHTHFPGYWREPGGVTVINTGSFCGILGGLSVDVAGDRLVVRRIKSAKGAYLPGKVVNEFAL
jgi:predicted phosphodiesterase